MKNIDCDYFLRKWYWMTLETFSKKYSLTLIDKNNCPEKMKSHHNVKNNIIMAATCPLSFFDNKDLVVIGGPCISDSLNSPTIESVAEIANLIKTAKTMQRKAVVFVGVEEEQIRTGKELSNVGNAFESITKKLASALQYDKVFVERSDSKKMVSVIQKQIELLGEKISNSELNGLYNVGKSMPNAESLAHLGSTKFNYEIHKRFIATYLPQTVQKLLDLNTPLPLMACENIQQLKAVKNAQAMSVLKGDYVNGPHQLIHLPFPSISGDNRMYRSLPQNKIYLSDNRDRILKLLKGNPKKVLNYYLQVWPSELKIEKLETRKDFATFIQNLNMTIGSD